MRKKILAITFVLLTAGVFTGCSEKTKTDLKTTEETPQPQKENAEPVLERLQVLAGDEILYDEALGEISETPILAMLTETAKDQKKITIKAEADADFSITVDGTVADSGECTVDLDNTSGGGKEYLIGVSDGTVTNEYTLFVANYLDPDNPYETIWPGIHERTVTLSDGTTRPFLIYIPEGAIPSAGPGVLVIPDSGMTAMEAYESSGWKEFADAQKRKPMIFFAEPLNGGQWNITEDYGTKAGDVEYLSELFGTQGLSGNQDLFLISEAKSYVYGYGDGGTLAHMTAMVNPIECSALATVGGSNVTDEYMAAAREAEAVNLGNFSVENSGFKLSDFPVAVWIIDDSDRAESANAAVLEYWKTVNGTETAAEAADGREAYIRREQPENPVNQDSAAYTVYHSDVPGAAENCGKDLIETIYSDFLDTIMKWYGDPGGDMGIWHDVEEIGFVRYEEKIDGYLRNWYVYVPENVRSHPDMKVPVLFCCAGYQTQGDVFANCTGFYKLAEEKNFIVVYPSQYPVLSAENPNFSGWNGLGMSSMSGQDDVAFLAQLKDKILEEYPMADEGRFYLMGLSNGSSLSNLVFATRPELFAAITSASGSLFVDPAQVREMEEVQNRTDTETPILTLNGEYDLSALGLDYVPNETNQLGGTIKLWTELNGTEMPDNWEENFAEFESTERFNELVYEKNGIPLVQYAGIKFFPHTYMYEESVYMWEWMSRFTRSEDGSIVFDETSA